MSHFVQCDRCHTKRQHLIPSRELPSGWERVCGADLCDMCSQLLHKFLQPQPILTTAERADAEKNA